MNKKYISCQKTSKVFIALTFPLIIASCGQSSETIIPFEAPMNSEKLVESEKPQESGNTLVDTKYIDGTPIRYVVLGKQIWTAENLRVTKFRDGTPIQEAQSAADWMKTNKNRSAAYCFANGDPAAARTEYGLLYNGHAITSERGICPNGWHIPTPQDVEKLIAYLGENPGTKLKASYGWNSSLEFGSGNGSNSSAMWFVGAGARNQKGRFDAASNKGNLVTSYMSGGQIDAYQLQYLSTGIDKFSAPIEVGLSCRCLKDNESTKELDKSNQVVPQAPAEELEEDEAAD